jgi:hypothetical protein
VKAIWKYTLAVCDQQFIDMPRGAKILTAQMQGSYPTLWVLVDPEAVSATRNIRVFGTGRAIGGRSSFNYIGTVQEMDGALVRHIFEEV